MAWYAELCRRHWYCINETNMIALYRKYLYDTWYDSLTDEQKKMLEEKREREKEQSRQQLEESIMHLGVITGACFGLYNRQNDKYHGVYDEDGFPNKNFR